MAPALLPNIRFNAGKVSSVQILIGALAPTAMVWLILLVFRQ